MSLAGQTFFSGKDMAHLVSGYKKIIFVLIQEKKSYIFSQNYSVLRGDHLGSSDSEQGMMDNSSHKHEHKRVVKN